MRIRIPLMGLALLALFVVSGCAQNKAKPLFYWGDYESLVYQMYEEPGSADPTTQVIKLKEDIQQAQEADLPIAPGIHSHLAYMYSLQGKMSLAREEFLKEKQLYPESAHFVDGMLKRMEGK